MELFGYACRICESVWAHMMRKIIKIVGVNTRNDIKLTAIRKEPVLWTFICLDIRKGFHITVVRLEGQTIIFHWFTIWGIFIQKYTKSVKLNFSQLKTNTKERKRHASLHFIFFLIPSRREERALAWLLLQTVGFFFCFISEFNLEGVVASMSPIAGRFCTVTIPFVERQESV